MFNKTAIIKRISNVAIDEFGNKIPTLSEIGTTKIRFMSKSSDYTRTSTGYVKNNVFEGIIPYKTDVKQGDKLNIDNKDYSIIGIKDDGMGIFLNLTLE